MNRNRVLAVIPARYSSTRFPGKPLATIAGKPMVAHVVERACEAGCFDEVLVATDDDRIARAAAEAGARAVMTGACRSGTDRVAQAISTNPPRWCSTFRATSPRSHPRTSDCSRSSSGPTRMSRSRRCPSRAGRAISTTRTSSRSSAISRAARCILARSDPLPRAPIEGAVRRHVGLYGFQRRALLDFASWPETDLERIEGLEQLRALAHGLALRVLPAAADSVAVDVPGDVPRAEAALAALARERTGIRAPGSGGPR